LDKDRRHRREADDATPFGLTEALPFGLAAPLPRPITSAYGTKIA
jgi:hypothetical protein